MRLSNICLALSTIYSGFGAGTALALDFTSGNRTLDPRITFSRTTNATVTGSNGLIQNAPMNLLTYSEQFDNAVWTKSNATVTANNVVSPDGSVTADTLVRGASTTTQATLRVTTTQAVSTAHTVSTYVKAGTAGAYLYVRNLAVNDTFPNGLVVFNPATGSVVSAGNSYTSATMLPVGNGWYRCVVTGTTQASIANNLVDIGTCNASGVVTGNTGDSVYIWGAQLEVGSTATTYNPTTVKNLLGYTEHFDNAAWTKSNAFVQTNLLTYSQMFGGSWTSNAGDTVTGNAATAPDGTPTATLVALTTGTSNLRSLSAIPITAGATLTASMYLKAGAGSQFQALILYGASGSYRAWLNTTTGAISGGALSGTYSNGSMTAVDAGNGWWRVAVTATTATDTSLTWETDQANASGSYSAVAGSSFYCWGAQLVQGTSAGDYKATYAAAAAVGYPDIYGQPFAQKLVENTATSGHSLSFSATSITSTFYTVSAYLKAAERTWCAVQLQGSCYAFINLAAGAVGTTVGSPTVSVVDVGSGWYRVSLTAAATSTSSTVAIYASTGNGTLAYTGDGTSGIYIFGAQLSDSASVDPYVYNPVAAPTSTAYYGPRFDYDPVTLAPKGLLIEEQRTQLLLNSSLSGTSLATQNVTVTAVAHTLSFYGTGTVTLSGTSTAGPLVGTGAYPARSTLTFTPTAGTLTLTVTGTVQFAQLEVGAFATSFIPSGASQVTRAADSASMIGNNFARWFNQTEGSFFTSVDTFAPTAGDKRVIGLNGTACAFPFISSAAKPAMYDGTALDVGALVSANAVVKIATAYDATTKYGTSAGASVASSSRSATFPLTPGISAHIGSQSGTSAYLNGHVQRIAYYPRRLANTELQGITS